jgi:DNA end-binding protein Ku
MMRILTVCMPCSLAARRTPFRSREAASVPAHRSRQGGAAAVRSRQTARSGAGAGREAHDARTAAARVRNLLETGHRRAAPEQESAMAARPVWSGTLAFGLLHIPVSLMSGEKRVDLSFRMLDARDNSPIRYERVNAETGEEVPWKDIVKAYEYDKGNYVVLEKEDIASAAPESHNSIDVEAFVDAKQVDPRYFEKPYVLVPGKKAEKGYVLLRETLQATGRIGIARVVIRTREHLCAVMAHESALILLMMRYPQELVALDEYALPEGKSSSYRILPKELEMARQLIESMAGSFDPKEYKDEFRARLSKVIEQRLKSAGKVPKKELPEVEEEGAATNVVDFMSLLERSLKDNRRTPARAAPAKAAAAKAAPRKRAAAPRKAPAKTTGRSGGRKRA